MMDIYLVFVMIYTFLGCKRTLSIEWNSVSACYGITHSNFMSIQCEAGTVIALKDVRAMAKPISTGCPQEETALEPAAESCCRYDPGDCGATYKGPVAPQYYTLCHGRTSCSMLQPTWMDTAIGTDCDTDVYIARTSYMIMYYECISTQSVASPCLSLSVTDKSVVFWNDDYPTRMRPEQDGCSCSVEASCTTTIQITGLDIRFHEYDNECKQGITIKENGQSTHVGCESNNDYQTTTVYTSSSQFFTIELRNDYSGYRGYFWFEITGSSENANLTLSCGEMVQSAPKNAGKMECVETTNTTSTSTTSITTTTSPTTSSSTTTTTEIPTTSTIIQQSTSTLTSAGVISSEPTTLDATTTSKDVNRTKPNNESSVDNENQDLQNQTTPGTDSKTLSVNDTMYGNESIPTFSYSTVTHFVDQNVSVTTPANRSISSITLSFTTPHFVNGTNKLDNQTENDSADNDESTGSKDNGSEGKGNVDRQPSMEDGQNNSGDGGMLMIIIIIAVVAAILLVLFLILCYNRRKLKELLCGEKAKVQVDPEEYRTESPPTYDTMPSYLFHAGVSPLITSIPAEGTQLHFRKQQDLGLFENGTAGKKADLQPILGKIPIERRLPPVDTSLLSKTKRARKTEKLGFLNMIMTENQRQPLPRLNPENIEGAIRESYGAASHATTETEVIEKGKQNVERKTRMRKKKKKLLERIHGQAIIHGQIR